MSSVRYRKLPQSEPDFLDDTDSLCNDTDGFVAAQFVRHPPKVPWKAICYAVVLFLVGSILLICGCLLVTGHIDSVKYGDRFWPLIFLGSLMFIPGSYHTYFAYKAWSGDPDWSFEEFPEF
jgi:hypothetical protein